MITLLGAAPNTGNQGVSALCYSAVSGLAQRGIATVNVADHGLGRRQTRWSIDGRDIDVGLIGLSNNRRLWRGDCLRTVAFLAQFGGLGNAAAHSVLSSCAVLDVSGGDSFTDLYGEKRFQAMCRTKRLALDNGRPLILLPQTLGPFKDSTKKAEAVDILRRAHAIWVRDSKSYEFLKSELGSDFDPARHHLGVDMAVLLPTTQPAIAVPSVIDGWLSDAATPVAGLNVSGLLWQNAEQAQADFGLADNHRRQLLSAARTILDSDPNMRLVLVPHVNRPENDPESDWEAARALETMLQSEYGDRTATLPQDYTAPELKATISRMDWFAGARMHATIAGFSSGVPTLGLGYSDKAAGVFEECGFVGSVADLREMDAETLAHAVKESLEMRAQTKHDLDAALPALLQRASDQMDQVAAAIRATEV
ncbi:polysaccharide pyruvyl transferase family protein [Shimia thalassica]|uniref:polysaccharide pyruvyl transferase family protein n=1 Tax=Shimia thalassica TaxID=1715693 RepID=UPI001C091C4E|nr:polysaccharide pyruvyl transferase family protein [Shimia thalassica]MBU2941222.1 polysaccharide pyruvyl transferase family protein [Shimia thalassica]MDO6503294.1 polysaccharide pyruvyl transferase family protein [Shimia thalassica]